MIPHLETLEAKTLETLDITELRFHTHRARLCLFNYTLYVCKKYKLQEQPKPVCLHYFPG